MGQTDTNRIHHEIGELPTEFRDFSLQTIIDDIAEEISGIGYFEVSRETPADVFIESITFWDGPSKTLKRADCTFDRSNDPPFINEVTKNIYGDDGTTIVATTVITISRTGNKRINNVTTVTTRP